MSDSDLFRSVRRPDRRRVHLAVRVVRWLVVLVVLAVFGVAGWLLWRATNTLEPMTLQTFVLNETDPDAPTDEVRGTSTTLVVGVDRRQEPPDDLADADGDPRGAAVTPAVLLLQRSPSRPGTAVLTFPSDLAVYPPGIGQTRLDRVQAIGGPDLLLSTLQDATGMPIDHYVEVDLAGVVPLVDAVGGVEVCLDEVVLGPEPVHGDGSSEGAAASPAPTDGASPPDPITAPTPAPTAAPDDPTDLPGCQVLDGPAAAGFLASRSDASQQVSRQRRRLAEQHALLGSVLARVTEPGVLANPFRTDAILDALPDAVRTDVELGLPGQVRVAGEVADHDPDGLVVRVVPTQRLPGEALQQFQPEQAEALFAALRGGGDLSGIGTSTTREIGAADVSVVVVNGVGIEGLAGRVSSFLTQREFVVGGALNPSDLDPRDDWDRQQVVTTLRYVEGNEDLAQILIDALGDLPLEVEAVSQLPPMPRDVTVEEPTVLLEVGSGWDA